MKVRYRRREQVLSLYPETAAQSSREKIDFLKLDIEGAEYEVLQDCQKELRDVQNLFVEYHSPASSEQRLSRILEILSGAGFRYQIHEAFTSPHPFLDRRLAGQMDLQLNISAFRLESNASYSSSLRVK